MRFVFLVLTWAWVSPASANSCSYVPRDVVQLIDESDLVVDVVLELETLERLVLHVREVFKGPPTLGAGDTLRARFSVVCGTHGGELEGVRAGLFLRGGPSGLVISFAALFDSVSLGLVTRRGEYSTPMPDELVRACERRRRRRL